MNKNDFCRDFTKDDYHILSKSAVAKLLNISERTLHRRVKTGHFLQPLLTPKGYIQGWFSGQLKRYLENTKK